MNKNYEALENRFNRMDALGGAISMLHWDMSAMMPKGGTASRTDQLAVLKTLHHSMITDSEVPELLDGAEQDDPNKSASYTNAQMVRVPRNLINLISNIKFPGYKNLNLTLRTFQKMLLYKILI